MLDPRFVILLRLTEVSLPPDELSKSIHCFMTLRTLYRKAEILEKVLQLV